MQLIDQAVIYDIDKKDKEQAIEALQRLITNVVKNIEKWYNRFNKEEGAKYRSLRITRLSESSADIEPADKAVTSPVIATFNYLLNHPTEEERKLDAVICGVATQLIFAQEQLEALGEQSITAGQEGEKLGGPIEQAVDEQDVQAVPQENLENKCEQSRTAEQADQNESAEPKGDGESPELSNQNELYDKLAPVIEIWYGTLMPAIEKIEAIQAKENESKQEVDTSSRKGHEDLEQG